MERLTDGSGWTTLSFRSGSATDVGYDLVQVKAVLEQIEERL